MPYPKLTGPSEFIPRIEPFDMDQIKLAYSPEESNNDTHTRILHKLAKSSALLDDLDQHQSPIKATFVERDEFGLGRDENGRHDLMFGQLVVTSQGRSQMPAFVAAKAYKRHEIPDMVHEIAATNYMNSLAEIQNSFLPMGVWRNAQGIMHMITLYEHGVKSYDNTFWVNKDIEPEALRPERLRTAFQDCIWGIGYMHGAGLVHGDAEVKNLAHDGKNVRFIDLEDVMLMPKTANGKIEVSPSADDLRMKDITTFIATSLQVDENREDVMRVLGTEKAAREIALYYQKGLHKGGRDSELSFEKAMTTAEITALINHLIGTVINPMLKVSQKIA